MGNKIKVSEILGSNFAGDVTGTEIEQADGTKKRALDVELTDRIVEVSAGTQAQHQLNSTLQTINETLLRIEFLLKSIGE